MDFIFLAMPGTLYVGGVGVRQQWGGRKRRFSVLYRSLVGNVMDKAKIEIRGQSFAFHCPQNDLE